MSEVVSRVQKSLGIPPNTAFRRKPPLVGHIYHLLTQIIIIVTPIYCVCTNLSPLIIAFVP
jgi:hypothetical protein